MDLLLLTETFEAIKKLKPKSQTLKGESPYSSVNVDTKFLDTSDLELVLGVVSRAPFSDLIQNRRIRIKVKALLALGDKDRKEVKVKKLELLADVLYEVIDASSPRKWVYKVEKNLGMVLPYFVSKIEYNPPENRSGFRTPANVEMTLSAIWRGGGDGNEDPDRTVWIKSADIPGTASEILSKSDLLLEAPELLEEYEADLARYREESKKTGVQYWAKGLGYVVDGRCEIASFDRDGRPGRVVMDDLIARGSDSEFVGTGRWSKKHGKGDDDDDGVERAMRVPLHPIARVFDLRTHQYLDTHITNLESYQYDPKMSDKLVLPDDHKELIDALTDVAVEKMDDIVKGKAAGIIIVCSGDAGTGKTLSAEVYSETVKRPLYTVQCSQLGTEPTGDDGLEQKLNEVLERATRWGAVLLIDEADVYIHERGSSLIQNAVVGVFLRVLEYYAGILFLTTNRATVIDDAIMSRATAHVRYGILGESEAAKRRRLWEVLLAQYGVSSIDIESAIAAFPALAGRSIRQLIKLSSVMAKRKNSPVSIGALKWAAKFHDFSENEKANLL